MTPFEPDSLGIWLYQVERRATEHQREKLKAIGWILLCDVAMSVLLIYGAIKWLSV